MTGTWGRTDRAQNNVLGNILLVGIVVLLALLLWQFASGGASTVAAPAATFAFAVVDDDLRITHETGSVIPGDELMITEPGDSSPFGTWAGDACVLPVADVSSGTQCLVPEGALTQTVLVVWEHPDRDRRFVLARWDNPGSETVPVSGPTRSGPGASTSTPTPTPVAPVTTTTVGGSGGSGGGSGGSGSGGSGGSGSGGTGDGEGGETTTTPTGPSTPTATPTPTTPVATPTPTLTETPTSTPEEPDADGWAATARYGGPGDWETRLAAGDDETEGQHRWRSGQVESFTLVYDGSTLTFHLGEGTVRQAVGPSADGALTITANAFDFDGQPGSDGNVVLSNLRIDEKPLTVTRLAVTDGEQQLRVSDPDLADGFVLKADVSLTWDADVTPGGDDLGFAVHLAD